jgi:hypothetical protein
MKRWLGSVILAGTMATVSFAAGKGPEIQIIDNKLSIDAEAVPLSRLLRLLDLATGMNSKVPPELANRNISVKFSGLDLSEGVRKMFQGQPLDYIVIEGQSIVVTAAAQTIAAGDSLPAYTPPAQTDQPFMFPATQDFTQPGLQPGIPQQPAMIQTPFGPMANPRADQPMAPNAPLSIPGQQPQNSLFPDQPPPQQPNQPAQVMPGFPGAVPGNPPFGAPSPFGSPVPGQQVMPNSGNPFTPTPIFTNPAPGNQRTQ